MRPSNRLFLASFTLLSCAACGSPPPPAAATTNVVPKTSAVVAVAPPTRARWVFSHPERGLNAKLDLTSGETLYAGQNGRRALAKGDAPLVDAPTLALEGLSGVLRESGGDYAFVADDGDVYASKEPLGALDAVRNGPLGEAGPDGKTPRFSSLATGRAAIVGVASDGRVLRSATYGKQWSAVDFAGPSKPYGHAISVALDSRGNGLLLAVPQRLYLTHDDGATWAPIASPGIGASFVRRDGADQVFLHGPNEHAKLDGGRLTVTAQQLEPLRKPPAGTTHQDTPQRTLLSGDRIVELTFHPGARPNVEVTSHKLGESQAGGGAQHSELVSASAGSWNDAGASPHITGFGSSLLYARADDVKDADGAVTTTIMESDDHGATWKKGAVFKGHVLDTARWGGDRETGVALGPSGWAYVKAMCPPGSGSESSERCVHRQVRPASSGAFEDMASVEDFAPMRFAFDEGHAKVYVLGRHEGRDHVYESALGQNKFTRMKLVDEPHGARHAITVDPTGVLRVMAYDSQNRQWKLFRHGADGAEQPTLYVPLDSGEVALAGQRGIVAGDHRGWETADGGETWSRVGANGGGSGELACTSAGCTMGGAERVGWDLPAYESPEKMAAGTESKKAPVTGSRPQPVVAAPIELTCKPAPNGTTVMSSPGSDTVDQRASDVRWSVVKDDKDHKVSVFVGGRAGVRELALLGPEPPKPAPKPGAPAVDPTAVFHRTSTYSRPDGVVAIRAASTPKAGEPPQVDLEIAWFSSATGKVSRKSLPKFKSFTVSRWGSIGEAQVVEGGIVFQSVRGEPAHFIHDDGKDDTFSVQGSSSVFGIVRAGNRWIVPVLFGDGARLTFSDDNGKTWTTKTWRLDDSGSASIGKLNGKVHLAIAHSAGSVASAPPMLLFPLDVIGDDPPAPVVVASGSADAPCDAQATSFRGSWSIPADAKNLHVHIDEPDKTTMQSRGSERITHPTTSGAMCTAAYRFPSLSAIVYAEPKGYAGYQFRRVPDPKDSSKSSLVAETLTCAPAAAGAKPQ